MKCPGIKDLPSPSSDRKGWPWTEETPPLTTPVPGGNTWPRMSIVTPSYNQGDFLEETIRSVLLQGYPDLEYIIIDGGSSDQSLDIIRKYEDWISYWVSEPDRGHVHALNKGFSRVGGHIIAWLNSDDVYYPGVLQRVAEHFEQNGQINVIFGDSWFVDEKGKEISLYRGVERPFIRRLMYWRGWEVPQPTVFIRRSILEEVGLLDESYKYSLDYEWFLRISRRHYFYHIGSPLAQYRLHTLSKTGVWSETAPTFFRESKRAIQEYIPAFSPLRFYFLIDRLAFFTYKKLKKFSKAILRKMRILR
jgi:glycosyltransferase involved in cell wall biosynthesis